VSGRWFRSNSLLNGPWSYVTAADLPPDFAEIPVDSPKASILVSVPGTPQAEEALIANQIPQTAVISRKEATLVVKYYGAPDFQLIEGTHLLYAVNTTTPIVYVPNEQAILCCPKRSMVCVVLRQGPVDRGHVSTSGHLRHTTK
jgi:hypothetical protein